MFTGIVQGTARVVAADRDGGLLHLVLELPEGRADGLVPGASVAVAGTCLTAVAIDGRRVAFDCIGETLARTTLGALRPEGRVNVERAARFGDEIGGHLLSGHVAVAAEVVDRAEEGGNLALWFAVPAPWGRYVLPKGYVAIDGCSLTVGEVRADGDAARFAVHLIPETRRITTLDALAPGDRVNLEVDAQTQAVVDTVARVLAARSS
jgi:riboflavin synthase